MPGHTFLYSPPVQAIRELISSGELGDIYFISTSRVNLGLHQSDASVIWDLGPHDFSILSYWLGERPSSVTALSRGCIIPDTPDVAFIQLEYASGVIANVELAWLAPSKLSRTTVVGSHKMVVYDDTSVEPVRVFDSGVNLPDPSDLRRVSAQLPYRVTSSPPGSPSPNRSRSSSRTSALRFALARTVRSSPQLGVDVVSIVEAADRSLAEGARVAVTEAGVSIDGPTA